MEYSAQESESKTTDTVEITPEMEQAGFDAWTDWSDIRND
jgi:hypothetical protein